MLVCPVQVVSGVDNESKCQTLSVFLAAILVNRGGTPIWRLHTGIRKFVRNISTNSASSGRLTNLKLGEKNDYFA